MAFLAPLFLAGLAALAIPVLIHLIQRERKNVVRFPSLMFVRRIPYSSIRRRRIHNWALLLLRLAALALIIAAFARPFLRSTKLVAAAGGAREVIVLLDRSYSMGHGDQWERAKRAAADAVAKLSDGDRGTLVRFDSSAEVAVQPTDDNGRLTSEIEATPLSAGATRFGPALKLAGSLLAASTMPRREVILVSDFQRSGWAPGEGLRLPSGTVLTTVSVQADASTKNLAVTPITIQREQASGQDRVTVTAGVLNRSNETVTNLPIALELDGHVAQTAQITVQANGSASTTFPPATLSSVNTRGTVRIGDDALARDNAFYFVLSPPRPIAVTIVNASRGARDPALYLSRALAIGESPRFEIGTHTVDDLSDDLLSRSKVVIMNDASPSEAVAARLKRFVENGGGLLVVYGSQATWPSAAADLLPAMPTGTVDRSRGAGSLGNLEYGHAVFEPFRAPRSGDFSAARFYSYRNVTPAKDAQTLARFDDGAPAVVERAVGRGRVLLWASTLDLFWNDLALKPVYLPFVHQLARRLADYRERASWATVGQVIDLSKEGDPSRPRVALSPSGQRTILEGDQGRVLELSEQGFYEIRERGGQSQLVTVAASNIDLAESDRTPVDPAEMVAAVVGGPSTTASRGDQAPLPDEAQEKAQRIWWYLLFAGILLLTGESVLAQRMSRANA